jgi:C4-dicarboxylate-specific signal transduction histidine kinase
MNRLSIMGELTASLAHEIAQPIATARNNARAGMNFLDKDPPELGKVRKALGGVLADADRAGDIIDRIRDQVKKAPPRKHRFDLNEAINEVLVLAKGAIIKHRVSVQALLTEQAAPVEGDRVQLQQVALNLVLNAVEAMGSVEVGPRELLISTERSQVSGVLMAVRDSGPGIDPARPSGLPWASAGIRRPESAAICVDFRVSQVRGAGWPHLPSPRRQAAGAERS